MNDSDSSAAPPERQGTRRQSRSLTAAPALTRRAAGLADLLAGLAGRVRARLAEGDPDCHRPLIHYALCSGFMNGSNGLIFHGGE